MNDIREKAYKRWLANKSTEHTFQKPLNEFLSRRWAAWPPMKRTPEMNRKVIEIIIAKVLFAK